MYELIWHSLDDIKTATDKRNILAMCFMMWGNCYVERRPEYFGDWMVIAGDKLGFPPTQDQLLKNLDKIMAEYK